MSPDKTVNVARAVMSQLHSTEEAIDSALGEAANLMETYVSSRRALRLSTLHVGDVHDSTLKAMQAMHLAQQHMSDAHRALSRIQAQIGMEADAIIPPFDKPPPGDTGNGGVTNNHLRAPKDHSRVV